MSCLCNLLGKNSTYVTHRALSAVRLVVLARAPSQRMAKKKQAANKQNAKAAKKAKAASKVEKKEVKKIKSSNAEESDDDLEGILDKV